MGRNEWVVIPIEKQGYMLGQVVGKWMQDGIKIKVLPEGVVNPPAGWWAEMTSYTFVATYFMTLVHKDKVYFPDRFAESPAYPDALATMRGVFNFTDPAGDFVEPINPVGSHWVPNSSLPDDPPDQVRVRHLCGFEALIPLKAILESE